MAHARESGDVTQESGREASGAAARDADTPRLGAATVAVPSRHEGTGAAAGSGSGGTPSALPHRATMESAFGQPLGDVRVRTGDASLASLAASAAATPAEVRFADAVPDVTLVAHEVAHIVQHRRAAAAATSTSAAPGSSTSARTSDAARRAPSSPAKAVSSATDSAEREADRVAPLAAKGRRVHVSERPTARVHRKGLADADKDDRAKATLPHSNVTLAADTVNKYFKKLNNGNYEMKNLPPSSLKIERQGIPAEHETPMVSIAMELKDQQTTTPAGTTERALQQNRTVTVFLELQQHGLSDGNFRFSWIDDTLYIESGITGPGVKTAVTSSTTDATATDATLSVTGATFTLSGSWGSARRGEVEKALGLFPAAALKTIDGMKFSQGGKSPGTEHGHYDQEKHRVTIYREAFKAGSIRYGDSNWTTNVLAHEIAHAIDLAPLRKAWDKYQGGGKAADLEKARGESGGRWDPSNGPYEVNQDPKKTKDNDFRKAALKDGVAVDKAGNLSGGITSYSDTDWQEMYAENFALFAMDPATFKLIRPNLHAHFTKRF